MVNKSLKPFSKNRIVCFQLKLLEETGKYTELFKNIKELQIFITDKAYILELECNFLNFLNFFIFYFFLKIVRVYLKMGKIEQAKEAITKLLERNTEKHEYHVQYLTTRNLLTSEGNVKEEEIPKILEVYTELKKKFPRSFAISRMPLTYARGEQFRQLFIDFIQPNLVKGVPSLFNSIKNLYSDSERKNIISQVVSEILDSVEKNNTFPKEGKLIFDFYFINFLFYLFYFLFYFTFYFYLFSLFFELNESFIKDEKLPITTVLWVWIFSSRHFDTVGDGKRALELIDKAIEHTPTLEDLYFIKAKFAKHLGDLQTAHRLVDKARSIDIADRFMNTKAAVYALRAGKFEVGELTAFHFAKEQGILFLFFIFYFLFFIFIFYYLFFIIFFIFIFYFLFFSNRKGQFEYNASSLVLSRVGNVFLQLERLLQGIGNVQNSNVTLQRIQI